MEGMLPYENQLYFNALYFHTQGILLAIGFVYKPQMLRLASIWSNPRKRRFDMVVFAVMAVILGITVATALFMGFIGIPIMSFMYGVNFERFRNLALLSSPPAASPRQSTFSTPSLPCCVVRTIS